MAHRDLTTAHTPRRQLQPKVVAFWGSGSHATASIPDGGAAVIGRAVGSDLWIDDPSVSRKHALIRAGMPPTIEDLGSSNGTLVGGRRIESGCPVPLLPGVLVEIGIARVVVEAAPVDDVPIVAVASAMGAAWNTLDLAAKSGISILLLGETGVGKEVMAEEVHRRSPRANAPLVRLNCAAYPENLLESELFGHEKGAFTGAIQAKAGLLESAHGGTVFLDEIGELPATAQIKLLRVLERREVSRIGALKPKSIDVRFVSATHRDLLKLIDEGTFRQDLYFRFNGITIDIPPLRERTDEILPLARRFAGDACTHVGRAPLGFSAATENALLRYAWPGNVRELKNVIERAVVLCQGAVIEPVQLALKAPPARAPSGATSPPPDLSSTGSIPALPGLFGQLADVERERIVSALAATNQNQSQAAKLLGISRGALINRLDEYGIPRPRKPSGGA